MPSEIDSGDKRKLSICNGRGGLVCVAGAVSGIFLAGCASTVRVAPLDEIEATKKVGRGGIMLYLPRTIVSVTVPVKRTEVKKGDYSDFCQLFLGMPTQEPQAPKFEIGKPVYAISGRRDEKQVYFVKIPGGPFTANDLSLELTAEGVFSKGSTAQENKTIDFVISTVELAGKIASTVAKGFSARPDSVSLKYQAALIDKCPVDSIKLGLEVDALQGSAKSQKIEELFDPNNAQHDAWLRWLEFDKKYQSMTSLVKDIGALSNAKNVLLGTVGTAETKEAAIKEIDGQLAELAAPFLGLKTSKTWSAKFEVDPKDFPADFNDSAPKPVQDVDLFKLVRSGAGAGILEAKGDPPDMPENFAAKSGDGAVLVSLHLEGKVPPTAEVTALQGALKRDRSFRYRIPAETTVKVELAGKPVAPEEKLFIAQYGNVGYLPAGTGSVQTKWDITLNGATGALEKVTLNNKNFDPALVGRVADSANGVVGAVADRELTRAQREHDILKAKSESVDYRKKLNGEVVEGTE